jgi:TetR/AcrR family transcriptional regulator
VTHKAPDAPTRLIRAALEEFAAHGAAGARTERIARRAGVNKQLIHYYFRNKQGLYAAVVAHAATEVATALAALPLVGLTAVERLRRLVRGQFDFLLEHPAHTALLLAAGDGADGTVRWADTATKPLADLLRDGQATGFFRDDIDPEAQARLALLLALGYFAIRPVTQRWGPPVQWRDQAAELVVRGCTW